MTLALLFPGQGSQQVGMGRDLAAAFPEARRVFEEADDVLGFALTRTMWEGTEAELTETRIAQPAILAHSVAAYRVAREALGPAALLAGHSLGEFSAHVVAGTVSFDQALEAVHVRGELMFAAGEARPGTMAAVLGLGDDEVVAVCETVESGLCVPANFNADGQVVISGERDGVREGMEKARSAGAKKVLELSVSGAFHSPLMQPAEAGLKDKLDSMEFRDPEVPVVSNVTAEAVSEGTEARRLLVRQLTSAVRWSASVATMTSSGVDRFAELGPGSVLSGLNRRNARGIPSLSVGGPGDMEAIERWSGEP